MKRTLPKPTLLELDEYDMNQRIIEALTHVCSHAILFSIVDEAKDAVKISEETQLSLSNVYKTLTNLEKLTLITIEKFDYILEVLLLVYPGSNLQLRSRINSFQRTKYL